MGKINLKIFLNGSKKNKLLSIANNFTRKEFGVINMALITEYYLKNNSFKNI